MNDGQRAGLSGSMAFFHYFGCRNCDPVLPNTVARAEFSLIQSSFCQS